MNNEKIQQWAEEAGIGWAQRIGGMDDFLKAFAALVRNAAIEECAHMCDYENTAMHDKMAEAIRGLKS